MKRLLHLLSAALLLPVPALAALNVFACEPEWAALAQELGGERVSAFAATTARQDPHRIEARPSLIARMRQADLAICTGSQLEIGWLPLLLTQSGNARVQPGAPGFLEASQYVAKLEVPSAIDRAMGDIHPAGNPHIHLDPRNIAKVAAALTGRLAALDPAGADFYRARAADFATRWQAAVERWEREGSALKALPIVVYHRDLSYLIHWLGMREAGSLEPKPGIPPTPAHLAELVERMKRDPARLVVYSPYSNPKAAEFLAERTGIPAAMLPYTVGGTEQAKDLFGLFDDTLRRLRAGVK